MPALAVILLHCSLLASLKAFTVLFAIFLFTTLSLCLLTGLVPPSWGPRTQVVLNCICRTHLAQYMNKHILWFGQLKIWPLPKDL